MSASQAEILSPNPKTSAESQAVIRAVDLTKVYPGGVRWFCRCIERRLALGDWRLSLAAPAGAGWCKTI
jgi:hypothetical protein